ncbi:hypothetical protein GCK32_019845, partial [Trichostrongylus colubriformis]
VAWQTEWYYISNSEVEPKLQSERITSYPLRYVGQPIQCWIPAQFTGAWEQYSENYCFVQNTYFVRPDSYIPDSVIDRENSEIGVSEKRCFERIISGNIANRYWKVGVIKNYEPSGLHTLRQGQQRYGFDP